MPEDEPHDRRPGAGSDWLDARGFGARGDGSGDDTAAVQAAIDALPRTGGTVYLSGGTYRLTRPVRLRDKVTLRGAGDGATVLAQNDADADALTGTAVERITIEDLWLTGGGSGSGSGLTLRRGGNDAVPYASLRRLTAENFGGDGIAIENGIVSVLDRVVAVGNGRYGINLYGQPGGAAGTSCALTACYGNANGQAGIRLAKMVYCALTACAGDHNPVAYLIEDCQGITLSSCGAEDNATGLAVTAGSGVTATGLWVHRSRGLAAHIARGARAVTIIGAIDDAPDAASTGFVTVDKDSHAELLGCSPAVERN